MASIRRDEDWWDAVGKDMWRWEQELKAQENEQRKPMNTASQREHNGEAAKLKETK